MDALLFVDDDERMLATNRIYFTKHGFEVFTATSGCAALDVMRSHPIDCVVLDIMMPQQNGYVLCRQLKEEFTTPIVFLTGLTAQNNLYQGFLQGGDDYLTKPYDFRELELRIRARILQKRGTAKQGTLLEFGPLTIDTAGRQTRANGVSIPLTANEFDILVLLARSPGILFSPKTIYQEIWHLPDLEATHTVRVHVGRLRQKLEAACPQHAYICTVWGKGYRFDGTAETLPPESGKETAF